MAQLPSWRTTLCRLSVTAYLIYLQLPSTPGGRSSIRNLRTRHTVVTGTDYDYYTTVAKWRDCRMQQLQRLTQRPRWIILKLIVEKWDGRHGLDRSGSG